MAFDDEVQPRKKMKMDSGADNKMYRIDGLFPKITNLEYFAAEILFNIFDLIDDHDLLHIANISDRFKPIAHSIYATKYFVIKHEFSDRKQQQHRELIKHNACKLKGIEIHGFTNIDAEHWAIVMLNTCNRLTKLRFVECHFENAERVLSQFMGITHLTFESCIADEIIQLPTFGHLKHFEVRDFIDIPDYSFISIIENNPQLENLIVCDSQENPLEIISSVNDHLNHLKGLNLARDTEALEFPVDRPLTGFMNTFERLESLGLSVDQNSTELVQYLGIHCKNIKSLELVCAEGNLTSQIIEALQPFCNVTTLSMKLESYPNDVDEFIKSCSNLCNLFITFIMEMPTTNQFLLSLFRNCDRLETIVINSVIRQYEYEARQLGAMEDGDDGENYEFEHELDTENPAVRNINVQFYDEFIEITRNRRANVELREIGKTVATVTKHEVIWRNMLIHWKGYDAIYNRSRICLLDLANVKDIFDADHKQPFDVILDYLDLSSLYSLYNVNKQSKQLVNKYVEKRSMEHGTFFITDDFDINSNAIQTFGRYITSMEARLMNNDHALPGLIKQYCQNLETFRLNQICRKHKKSYRYKFMFPQLRHFAYNSASTTNYFDLLKLPEHLEQLEFHSVVRLRGVWYRDSLKHLRKVIFKATNDSVRLFIDTICERLNIEVIFDEML